MKEGSRVGDDVHYHTFTHVVTNPVSLRKDVTILDSSERTLTHRLWNFGPRRPSIRGEVNLFLLDYSFSLRFPTPLVTSPHVGPSEV